MINYILVPYKFLVPKVAKLKTKDQQRPPSRDKQGPPGGQPYLDCSKAFLWWPNKLEMANLS